MTLDAEGLSASVGGHFGKADTALAAAVMDNNPAVIQQHIEQLVVALQHEGVLDEQFQQLMLLQDDTNPDFVAEVVQLYFEDSAGKIDRIDEMVSTATPNFEELDQLTHQFKARHGRGGLSRVQ